MWRILNFNPVEWLTRERASLKPKLQLAFQCRQCSHHFKTKVRRLYIDLNQLDQRQLHGQPHPRGEFIVPERIQCPRCKTIDNYRFDPKIFHLLTEIPLIVTDAPPSPLRPIQCIRYTDINDRACHPRDALEQYRQHLHHNPQDETVQTAYANTLRLLGYHEEAEQAFQVLLTLAPNNVHALLNLALYHGKRDDRSTARDYLEKLAAMAENASDRETRIYSQAADQLLQGKIVMARIEMTSPNLFAVR